MNRSARIQSLGLVTAALLLWPSLARAAEDEDEDGPPAPEPAVTAGPAAAPVADTADSVYTRSGSVHRGRVLEIVPGSHVSIAVEGAGPKRLPWSDTEKVVVASQSAVPDAREDVAHATVPTMVGPRARVHITAKNPVILYRRPAGTTAWSQACTSPCDVDLPIGDAYRITGNGVPQSREFRLAAAPGGAVDIAIDPPSTAGMVIGGTLAYGGALTAYVGLLVTLAGYSDSYRGEDTRDAGLISMAIGVGLGAVGLVAFLESTGTDVEQRGGGGAADAAAARRTPRHDAFLRRPSWRSVASSHEPAAPPAAIPLVFSTSF